MLRAATPPSARAVVAGIADAAVAAAGGTHTLVATSIGELAGFGADGSGQLGNSTDPATCSPDDTGLRHAAALPGFVGGYTYDGDGLRAAVTETDDGHLALARRCLGVVCSWSTVLPG